MLQGRSGLPLWMKAGRTIVPPGMSFGVTSIGRDSVRAPAQSDELKFREYADGNRLHHDQGLSVFWLLCKNRRLRQLGWDSGFY